LTEAIDLWQAAGADAASVADLKTVTIQILDIPGDGLGWAMPGLITLDTNAAGYGWFVDSTPASVSEFAVAAKGPAQGHVDLLTVIAHELGHELGLADDAGNDLMGEYLPVGARRLPEPAVAPVVVAPAPEPTIVTGPASQPAAAPSVGASPAPMVVVTNLAMGTIPSTPGSHPTGHHRSKRASARQLNNGHAGSKHSVIVQAGQHDNNHDRLSAESTLSDVALNLLLGRKKGRNGVS
jgi:hypothetical protein